MNQCLKQLVQLVTGRYHFLDCLDIAKSISVLFGSVPQSLHHFADCSSEFSILCAQGALAHGYLCIILQLFVMHPELVVVGESQ